MKEALPDGRDPDHPNGPIIWPNIYAANYRKQLRYKINHPVWLAKTKDARNAAARAYWQANKVHLAAKQKEWNARNPEKIAAIKRRYSERQKQARAFQQKQAVSA
jgi:hypothetical protein